MGRPQCSVRGLAVSVLCLLYCQVAHGQGRSQAARPACPLTDRFCQLRARFAFASAAVGNKVFYHGGLDANNPTRPWADDVLEVVDTDTLEVYTIAYPAAPAHLMTRRYRHVMAAPDPGLTVAFNPGLVMAGGQVDDSGGLSINTLNVLKIDVSNRTFELLRKFRQPGGQADVVFSTVGLYKDAMSFISTVLPHDAPLDSQRALRMLNLTDSTMSDGIVTLLGGNLRFLQFPLVTHCSIFGYGLPPYLVLEAQRDVTPAVMDSASNYTGSLAAGVLDPFAPDQDAKQGPLPITLELPRGLGASAIHNMSSAYLSGKTLSMQLMGSGPEMLSLVFWTLSDSTWLCGSTCPPGVVPSRTLVPVSVVSVWTIQLQPRGYSEFALSAALKYVAVGVPPGLQLKELATVTVPLLNTMKVSSQLMSSGLLVAMPYVGEVDLNLNSDPSNVAITSIPAGQTEFVVRGTALGTAGCAGWEAGAEPFVLQFPVWRSKPPVIRGGSRYTTACMRSRNAGVLDNVVAVQSSTGGGVAMYAVPLKGGRMSCMTWEAAAQAVLYEWWEYNPSGNSYAVLMDPATRQVESVQVRTPKGYPFATQRTACVFTDVPKDPLYLEYGGLPLISKGTPKQTPVSAMYAMRLRWPAKGTWDLVKVAGDDQQLPQHAAAAMACGPSRTAYMFGGLEDRGARNRSVYQPTASLWKIQVLEDAGNGYKLQAVSLRPRNKGPSARSGHVLLYLEPLLAERWGMTKGALLLHGGTNLAGVTLGTGSPAASAGQSTWRLDSKMKDNSLLTNQKGLQAYSDTWLYDIGRNRWQLLVHSSTPIPLMWHSGAVHVAPQITYPRVVLFGGTTIYRQGRLRQAASVSHLMLLDLHAQQLAWHMVQINITKGGTTMSAHDNPNSGICSVPGTSSYLMRRRKVVATAIPPRTWSLSGTSKQVVEQWVMVSNDMLPGDVVELDVAGGVLELLEVPLTVPGVVVQPAPAPQAPPLSSTKPHASRLPLGVAPANSARAHGAAASKWQSSRHTGGGLDPWSWSSGDGTRHALPGLRVMCLNSSSAFTLGAGAVLEDMLISGCGQSAISIAATAGNAAAVTLRRVALINNTGEQGAALKIAANASVVMEGCLLDQTNASATGSAVYAAEGSRLQLLDTVVRHTNGTGVYSSGDELVINNSRFLYNTARPKNGTCYEPGTTQGGGVFASAVRAGSRHLRVNITHSTFIGNTACSGGAVAVGQATQLFLTHSRFMNNEAWKGAAVMGLQGSCLVNTSDTAFAGNSADVDGGAVAMDGCQCSTGVTVHHSVNFTNNTAARQGGAVYVNGLFNMTVVFHTVRFHENTAGPIHRKDNGQGTVEVGPDTEGISAAGGALCVSVWQSRLTLVDVTGSNNTAMWHGGFVHMAGINSTLAVTNSSFTSNAQGIAGTLQDGAASDSSGGAISMAVSSGIMSVLGSVFANNTAAHGAAIALVNGLTLHLSDTFVGGNHARKMGGGVLMSGSGSVEFADSVFRDNTATTGGALCFNEARFKGSNSTFSNNSATLGGAVALWQPGTADSILSGCQFVNNTATSSRATPVNSSSMEPMGPGQPAAAGIQDSAGGPAGGGAMYMTTTGALVRLRNTTFVANSAPTGGAILALTHLCGKDGLDAACLQMVSCSFQNNTAVGGAGGALMVTDGSHVTCGAHPQQGLQLQSCLQSSQPTGRRLMAGEQQQANPSNSTTTKDGSSAGGGDGEPQPEPAARAASAVASTGNTVTRGYGNQVATSAIRVALSSGEGCRKDATPQNESRLPGLVTPGMVVSHAAYGEYLQVQLFDALGQCVWGGYEDASLQLQARLLLRNGQYADEPPMGTNETPRGVVLGNVTQAKNGSAAFRELRIFAEPGDYQLHIAATSSPLLNPLALALTVRSCASGEVVRTDAGLNRTQCVRCQPGNYTFNSSQECRICSWDDYAECDGAARVPMPGFYQSHPRNPQIHRCLWQGACSRNVAATQLMKRWANDNAQLDLYALAEQGYSAYSQHMCSDGHVGPLCGSCKDRYGRRGFQCTKCPEASGWSYILWIVIWLYLFGAVLIAGLLHVREVQQRHKQQQHLAMQELLQTGGTTAAASPTQGAEKYGKQLGCGSMVKDAGKGASKSDQHHHTSDAADSSSTASAAVEPTTSHGLQMQQQQQQQQQQQEAGEQQQQQHQHQQQQRPVPLAPVSSTRHVASSHGSASICPAASDASAVDVWGGVLEGPTAPAPATDAAQAAAAAGTPSQVAPPVQQQQDRHYPQINPSSCAPASDASAAGMWGGALAGSAAPMSAATTARVAPAGVNHYQVPPPPQQQQQQEGEEEGEGPFQQARACPPSCAPASDASAAGMWGGAWEEDVTPVAHPVTTNQAGASSSSMTSRVGMSATTDATSAARDVSSSGPAPFGKQYWYEPRQHQEGTTVDATKFGEPGQSAAAGEAISAAAPADAVPGAGTNSEDETPAAAAAAAAAAGTAEEAQQSSGWFVRLENSAAWSRFFSTEDTDEEDRQALAAAGSSSSSSSKPTPSSTSAAAAAAAGGDKPGGQQVVLFVRKDKFYLTNIIKLAVTHLQIVGIMRLIGLSWTKWAEDVLTFSDQSSSAMTWVSLDCALVDRPGLPRSLQRVLVQLLVPVAALVSVGVFWAAVAAWHAAKRQLFPYDTHYRPRIVLSVVLVFFYLYPSVTNVAVSLFTCAMVDDPNKPPDHALWAPRQALMAPGLRWSGDTNVVCWEGTHLWLTVGIALPQYILISLGFPLVLVWLLYKRRMVLGLRLVELQYGFLYESYSCRRYYWESVILLQKLVLVTAVTTLQSVGTAPQVLVVAGVLTIAMILQVTVRPYACAMLDSLQRASLYVLGLTLLLVTMLTLGSNSDPYSMASRSTHLAVLPLILVLNLVLMGLFVVCGILEARRLALHVLDRDKKGKVTCGDVWWFVNARLLPCLPCTKSGSQATSVPAASQGQPEQGQQLQQ